MKLSELVPTFLRDDLGRAKKRREIKTQLARLEIVKRHRAAIAEQIRNLGQRSDELDNEFGKATADLQKRRREAEAALTESLVDGGATDSLTAELADLNEKLAVATRKFEAASSELEAQTERLRKEHLSLAPEVGKSQKLENRLRDQDLADGDLLKDLFVARSAATWAQSRLNAALDAVQRQKQFIDSAHTKRDQSTHMNPSGQPADLKELLAYEAGLKFDLDNLVSEVEAATAAHTESLKLVEQVRQSIVDE